MSAHTPGAIPAVVKGDAGWARYAVFQTNRGVRDRDASRRGARFNSAELKYTDTTIGGNHVINPRPQFTRWADPKMPGLSPASHGMGEYYSEAIDDNAQRIHLQFGVPEYNSLTRFFGNFYDHSVGHMTNTGDASNFFFGTGKLLGYILTLPIQPILGASNLFTRVIALASGKPYSKYYYMKETMPLYWSTVSSMVNMIGVNMGIIEGPDPVNVGKATAGEIKALKGKGLNYSDGLSTTEMAALNLLLPDIMKADGGIDVYAIANRAQRLAAKHRATLSEIAENARGKDFDTYSKAVDSYLSRKMTPPTELAYTPDNGKPNLPDYLNKYYAKGPIGQGVGADRLVPAVDAEGKFVKGAAAATGGDKVAAGKVANEPVDTVFAYDTNDSFSDYFKADLNDGSAFVSFAVDHEGSMSESFTNSAKSSDIEGMMNGKSSQGRSMSFNLAGGNIGDGVIASTIEGFTGAVKEMLAGMADSVGMSGLAALGGAAYVDIPDFWDSASASLPKSNYTIKLATPYGNKLSILTNIYIPLCMLMAGALPRSTGKNSYTAPFLCNLFSKGRNIVRLGLIDNISITRGTGGIGWSVDGLPTAIDVSFSVLNLDKIMHIPMTDLAGPTDFASLSMFDEDTAMSDYMAVLGGLDLYDSLYAKQKMRLAWRRQLADIKSWSRPSQFASYFAGSAPGQMISTIMRGRIR